MSSWKNWRYNGQRRAQSAVDYLISKGIARDRMEAKGHGETRLLNHCANGVDCSVPEHQANRRTDFTVLENQMIRKNRR